MKDLFYYGVSHIHRHVSEQNHYHKRKKGENKTDQVMYFDP